MLYTISLASVQEISKRVSYLSLSKSAFRHLTQEFLRRTFSKIESDLVSDERSAFLLLVRLCRLGVVEQRSDELRREQRLVELDVDLGDGEVIWGRRFEEEVEKQMEDLGLVFEREAAANGECLKGPPQELIVRGLVPNAAEDIGPS